MNKNIFTSTLLGILLICFSIGKSQTLDINPSIQMHNVSPMIQGLGLVYSMEADSIYSDASMAQLYQDIGTSFLRWPGGTVTTHYHWDDLTGNGWADSWNPNYDTTNNKNPSSYMDLDEYMQLCLSSNVEPMLGINMSSGMEWNRQADGKQEAINLIKYCQKREKDTGWKHVKYFFMDNESYHGSNLYNKDLDNDNERWTATSYAHELNAYVEEIKKLVPDAIIIANWANKIRKIGPLATLINIAGDNIDYIDVHWYWRWGESNWNLWKAQTPMEFENQWYDGGTFVEEIEFFNNLTDSLNKPHIKLAALEWNIAPGDYNVNPSHTQFMQALMQSEMQMQFIQGDLRIASMWSTQWPNSSNHPFMHVVNSDNNYNPSPSAKIFELYQESMNNDVIQSSSSDGDVMITAVKKNNNNIIVFVLSKKDQDQNFTFNIAGMNNLNLVRYKRFQTPGEIVNINNNLGDIWLSNDNHWNISLRANTLSMIEFSENTRSDNSIFSSQYNDIQKEDSILGIYDLFGRKISRMQLGLNIVRYQSGKTKKIFKSK